ncbi:response regulator transcription factor [Flavobacteriaceae bacterium XHP0103]|uniref:response regulator transcription factor n=1 Tax=Marixanthotalea marina TaxID=2844359 RepID=UPI002989E91C|nr:response regulator transcription factor [Marixanthotalea marina]MBU3820867.1 response regulator transcription factor [Marixanthotalea marina]
MSFSIVIADDHLLMLKGLAHFLASKKYNVVGSAKDGNTAYNLIVKHKPDIAIVDIKMSEKNGLEIADACHKNNIATKVILTTFDKDESLFLNAKNYNIYGYILKEFAVEEIEICIENALKNKPYFSKEITSHNSSEQNGKLKPLKSLTKTELKIVKIIAENKTSKEIADDLSISIKTVHKHRSNIISKLNLDNKPASLPIWANLNKDFL